jgi:hypothetical protein
MHSGAFVHPGTSEPFDKLRVNGLMLENGALHALKISWGNLR